MTFTASLPWKQYEIAIKSWVKNVLGIDGYWEQQNVTEKRYPEITLARLNGPIGAGGYNDFQTVTIDTVTKERVTTSEGHREFTLTVKAATPRDYDTERDAVSLLSTLGSSIKLDSVHDLFEANAMAAVQVYGVVDISQVVNGEWISRASMDVRFRVASQIVERVPYFVKVQITSTQPAAVDTTVDTTGS